MALSANSSRVQAFKYFILAGAGIISIALPVFSKIPHGPKKSVKLIGGEWSTRVALIKTCHGDNCRKRHETIAELAREGRCGPDNCLAVSHPTTPELWIEKDRSIFNTLHLEYSEEFTLIFHDVEQPESKQHRLSYSEADYKLGTQEMMGKWYKMQCQVIGCTPPNIRSIPVSHGSFPETSNQL